MKFKRDMPTHAYLKPAASGAAAAATAGAAARGLDDPGVCSFDSHDDGGGAGGGWGGGGEGGRGERGGGGGSVDSVKTPPQNSPMKLQRDLVDSVDCGGGTALHKASLNGHTSVVQRLVE